MGSLAILGMPPFGVFASEFLILTTAMRDQPWATPILLAALGVAFAAIFGRVQPMVFGETTARRLPHPPAAARVRPPRHRTHARSLRAALSGGLVSRSGTSDRRPVKCRCSTGSRAVHPSVAPLDCTPLRYRPIGGDKSHRTLPPRPVGSWRSGRARMNAGHPPFVRGSSPSARGCCCPRRPPTPKPPTRESAISFPRPYGCSEPSQI